MSDPCTCQQLECELPSDYAYSNQSVLPPVPAPTTNLTVYYAMDCAAGEVVEYDGTLPSWITIDVVANRLVGEAGRFTGDTQAAANQAAQNALNTFAASAIAAGTLTCESVLTAMDDFQRANANPISSPMSDGVNSWTSGPGALHDNHIQSNSARSVDTFPCGSRVANVVFSPDQEASFQSNTNGNGLLLRTASDSDASGYLVYVANNTTIRFYRLDDTGSINLTQLGADETVTSILAATVITARIVGTTLSAYRDGVLISTRTDATYAAGNPGLYTDAGSNSVITEWSATDVP